jgi:hypothetical protein
MASFTGLAEFSDGTGREPAVAEMSRPVPARTALSLLVSDTTTIHGDVAATVSKSHPLWPRR